MNQVRVGAEVSRPVRLGAVSLAPFGAAHVRRDGGAGQRGQGLEVVAGLRAAAGEVRVDAQGRMLAVHSAAGYRERGVGVTLSVGNQDREGLSLSVSPRWGDSAMGGGTLWQDQVYRRYLPEAEPDEWALDARSEYGDTAGERPASHLVRFLEPLALRPPLPGRRQRRRPRVTPGRRSASASSPPAAAT